MPADSSAMIEADLTIDPYGSEDLVAVKVGQTFTVLSPDPTMEWEIEYHPSYLQVSKLSTDSPASDVSSWLFQAINPGQSELHLTGKAVCPEDQTCPPASAEFVITIDVLQE